MERCRQGEAAADGERFLGRRRWIASDESRPGRIEGRVWGGGVSVFHLRLSYFGGAPGEKVIAEGRKEQKANSGEDCRIKLRLGGVRGSEVYTSVCFSSLSPKLPAVEVNPLDNTQLSSLNHGRQVS